MENFEHIKEYLREELDARKERNKYYSLRSFAMALKISSGALSEILSGKRNLGPNKAQQIADSLKLDEFEKVKFLDLARKSRKKVQKVTPDSIKKISIAAFAEEDKLYQFSNIFWDQRSIC